MSGRVCQWMNMNNMVRQISQTKMYNLVESLISDKLLKENNNS